MLTIQITTNYVQTLKPIFLTSPFLSKPRALKIFSLVLMFIVSYYQFNDECDEDDELELAQVMILVKLTNYSMQTVQNDIWRIEFHCDVQILVKSSRHKNSYFF
ncbi:Hypothetical_protein [Hexamita inflata]|uniref:Hypothetical_protein n=1 Tax=Hexamita inflata TaxID=28002 RepID=A0ABP1GFJ5_9EUKA